MRRAWIVLVLLVSPVAAGEPASAAPLDAALALEAVFVDVAARATPWVVTLHTQGTEPVPGPLRGAHPIAGVGGGFLVDAAGTIYTNNHVAAGASRIEVSLADGRRFKADFIAGDRSTDVAVVRLLDPPGDLPVAPLGDSDDVRVGQFAIAVGAPFGYEGSFSVGHVSATGRRNVGVIGGMTAPGFEDLRVQDFLQVDTPIYPGNSGGPLVDLRGQVIGINTAIAGQAGGLGFAIPINLARRIAGELVASGRVRRGWLGVALEDLDPIEAATFGLGGVSGAMVAGVADDSPAAAARLLVEDVIVRFGDRPIHDRRDLAHAISEATIGEAVALQVRRPRKGGADLLTLSVVLGEAPPELAQEEPEAGVAAGEDAPDFGLELVPLDARGNRALGRAAGAGGVAVGAVAANTPAARAGLLEGDVLIEVDLKPVRSRSDVLSALADAGRTYVPLRVERAGRDVFLSIGVR